MEGKNIRNQDRHLELSAKLIEMGQALIKEGNSKNDYSITQVGNVLVVAGGLFFDQEDVYHFAQLCSMFSAKKILDAMENKNVVNLGEQSIKKGDDESYEDFIIRINKLRGDNGLEPLDPEN